MANLRIGFPANQSGWPAYYYSLLGDVSCISPIFGVFAFISWLFGRLNLEPPSILSMFTMHYAFLVPFLFNLGALSVIRQLLKSRTAALFAVILTAFSPGVLVNVSDIGFLEPLVYSLFFFSCWLWFIRKPEVRSFLLLILSCTLLALTLSFPFILWNLFFIPFAVALTIFLPHHGWQNVRAALMTPKRWQWGLAALAVLLCALPSLVTFSQTGTLLRATLGSEFYDFRSIKPGNLVELFALGLPQFGFHHTAGGQWALNKDGQGFAVATNYISVLCLPLAALGLIYGQRTLRLALLSWLIFFGRRDYLPFRLESHCSAF